jgi:hypothetical protein
MPKPCEMYSQIPCQHPISDICLGPAVWGRKKAWLCTTRVADLPACPYLDQVRAWWKRTNGGNYARR